MIEELKHINGYEITIEYNDGFDDYTPPSKRYQLIIKRKEKECINKYGLPLGGAKSYYKKWLTKQNII